jgi:hypothetical protein
MGMCEGNWKSEVRWEKKDTQIPAEIVYKDDGLLHVCPYSDGAANVYGRQIRGTTYDKPLENASCTQDGEGRFKISYERKSADGSKTFKYKGDGRLMHKVNGPAFIYGTVATDDGADSGSWQALRVGPAHGPGPGEDGKGGTHDEGGGIG